MNKKNKKGDFEVDKLMNTLVYKRTHRGDPDDSKVFGIRDCMGKVRSWKFDAVIGVGGNCPDSGHEEIARKVNWVGIGSYAIDAVDSSDRGPRLAFDFFYRFDEVGPDFEEKAPRLFHHMFEASHVRALLSQNLHDEKMQHEVQGILTWAEQNVASHPRPRPIDKKPCKTKCGC